MERTGRRYFLLNALGASIRPELGDAAPAQHDFFFAGKQYNVRMSVTYFNRQVSEGLWFHDEISRQRFCLSATGVMGRDCLSKFTGSLAIVRYRIVGDSGGSQPKVLRESVKTVDHGEQLDDRPPFEKSLTLSDGVASDIQAFGYEAAEATAKSDPRDDPWALVRQDLFLDRQLSPFLVLHWKHTLGAILLLDLIPGPGVRRVNA